MKVSELMNPKGVLLYAKIDNSADALGILVELQEASALSPTAMPTTMRSLPGNVRRHKRPSGAQLPLPHACNAGVSAPGISRCCCAAVLTGAHRTGNLWILCS